MKIAVLSDIHANLHAFEAVLKDARRRGAKKFLCLGDTVGYGAQPEECVQLVRSIGAVAVKGNHDVWALQSDAEYGVEVSPTVGPGLIHSRLKLSAGSQRWLRGLSGHDLIKTQRIVGHRSPLTTARYLETDQADLDALVLAQDTAGIAAGAGQPILAPAIDVCEAG